MQLNAAIWAAMKSQEAGNGDEELAKFVPELHDIADCYFPGVMDTTLSIFLSACEHNGRTAVVDKLSKLAAVGGDQKDIVRSYFDTHFTDLKEDKRTKLGPDMMSFTLQSIDNPKMRRIFIADRESIQPNKVRTSTPSDLRTREFTVGSCGSNELSDVFKDHKALRITLLLNRLLNTRFWQDIEERALLPYDFQISHIGQEIEAENVFEFLTVRANEIFQFLNPILGVTIRTNSEVGDTSDIFVEVCGWNVRQELQSECTAIIQLAKPCTAFRAANFLVFGDKPLKEDYNALRRYISIADSLTKQKLKEATNQFSYPFNSLSKVHQPSVKRAVVSRDENNEPVYGYTRDGQDITDKLRYCSLKRPVDGFHNGLGKVSQYSSLKGCSYVALSDGFTFIAMDLRDLQEQKSGLVKANFNSHYAIDLTETGSNLQMFQYTINAGYRSDRLRRGVEVLLHAAHEEFGEYEITADKSAAFRKKLKLLGRFKFHSRACTHNDCAVDARIFTRHRTPIIKRALVRLKQEFPALASCGKYESSAFGILEYFKVRGFQVVLETENSDPGRSRRVTKVNFYGHDEPATSKHKEICVLKEYECDAASVERMKRELEAYRRIAQLTAADQRHFAKLVAFGAIDVDGADPRLFILTEYVEGSRAKLPSTEEDGMEEEIDIEQEYEAERVEIGKVYDILTSVGVYHNDLEERNFRWQENDGEHFIKVFDFDYATFDDINSVI